MFNKILVNKKEYELLKENNKRMQEDIINFYAFIKDNGLEEKLQSVTLEKFKKNIFDHQQK